MNLYQTYISENITNYFIALFDYFMGENVVDVFTTKFKV